MKPAGHPSGAIERCLDPLHAQGVIEIVSEVIFAGPGQVDGTPDLLGNRHRLEHEVGLGFSSEGAAEESDVERDRLLRPLQHLGSEIPRRLRILDRCPDLAFVVRHGRHAGGGLHGGMAKIWHVVLGRVGLSRGTERGIHVALGAGGPARRSNRILELTPIRSGVVRHVRSVLPIDPQSVPPLEGRPGVLRHDRDAAQRRKAGRSGSRGHLDHLDDSRYGERLLGLVRTSAPTDDRAAGDGRVDHARQADVGPVDGRADRHVQIVHPVDRTANVSELSRCLERDVFGHLKVAGRLGQVAVPEGAAGRLVPHLVTPTHTFRRRHAPLVGSGLLQHAARHRPGFPQALEVVAYALGATGVLISERRVSRSLHHADARPVGLHLIGDDRRQGGAYPLPHLGPGHDDLHLARRVKVHEHVRREARFRCHGRGIRQSRADVAWITPCRRHTQHQAAARGRGGADEGSPRHSVRRDAETCRQLCRDARHDPPPRLAAGRPAAVLIASRIRGYAPQRHRFACCASSISASVGLGLRANSAAAFMIWPGMQ